MECEEELKIQLCVAENLPVEAERNLFSCRKEREKERTHLIRFFFFVGAVTQVLAYLSPTLRLGP